MLVPEPLLFTMAIASYGTAGLYLLRHLLNESTPSRKVAHLTTGLGLLLHFGSLLEKLPTTQGLDFSLFNVISLTSWAMLMVTWLTSFYRPIFGLLCLSIPVGLLGLSIGQLQHSDSALLVTNRLGIDLHILFSILAYSLISMAAVQAVLIVFLQRELKHRVNSQKWILFLPPLQEMEGLLFDLIKIGFVLLTVALSLGGFYVHNLFAQHLVHKTVLSIFGWAIFAWLLAGHFFAGWRGNRAIRFTLAGFASLLLGFVGSKVVLELILHRSI